MRGIWLRLSVVILAVAASANALSQDENGTQTMVVGELTLIQADDFEHGRSDVLHFVHDKRSGRVWRLTFEGKPPPDLRAGSIVAVRGHAKGDEMAVAADGIQSVQIIQSVATTSVVTGTLRTAVMLVNLLDVPVSCSVAAVSNMMFAISNSVDAVHRETSYGNVRYFGDILGPYTIGWA